jgi:very-short-patch-repair endonuclease
MRVERLPLPVAQFKPVRERRFRMDFAWPDRRVIVEVDGEVHRIKTRFHADIEKHALLVLAGWTVLRVGGREVRSGQAVQWVRQLLGAHPVAKTITYRCDACDAWHECEAAA